MTASVLWSANLPHNAFAAATFLDWSRDIAVPSVSPGATPHVFLCAVAACSGQQNGPQVTMSGVTPPFIFGSVAIVSPTGGSGTCNMIVVPNWDPTQTGNVNVHGTEELSETTGLILAALIGTDATIVSDGGLSTSGGSGPTATTPSATIPTGFTIGFTGNIGSNAVVTSPPLLTTIPPWQTAASAYKPPWSGFFQVEASVGTAMAFLDGAQPSPVFASWNNEGSAGWGAGITTIQAIPVKQGSSFGQVLG